MVADDAWAAAALDAEVARDPGLDPRDRALATEIVYGVLRAYGQLREEILSHARKGRAPDRETEIELLIATYQLVFLTRIPAFAAVDAAVRAITEDRGKQVGAFANAVLRRIAARVEAGKVVGERSLWTPPWLAGVLVKSLGAAGARAFREASFAPPEGVLAVADVARRDEIVCDLHAVRPVRPGRWSPTAIVVEGHGALAALPGIGERFIVQEEGSQLVAHAVGARAGEVVLDACAGRGHKTMILAASAHGGGRVDVADLHEAKLERAGAMLSSLGLAVGERAVVDLSVGVGRLRGPYDRVLVDAPCSGTGTLRRRPEILLRRRYEDLAELACLQLAILSSVAPLVRPGGRLIHAVCTVLRAECEDVVDAFLRAHPAFAPAPFDATAARAIAGEAAAMKLLPHVHGTDGYFVASLVKSC